MSDRDEVEAVEEIADYSSSVSARQEATCCGMMQ